MEPRLVIDGAAGEGGGQVLRSSLALSMITGRPFRIENIRSLRKKPGLRRQHLTAVLAAREVSGAEVRGAELGATGLTFVPGTVRGGDFAFDVGTAGSTTLVLQTVLPALALAPSPSRLTLEGGTHNPQAPPFDFLARAYLPLLARMGPRVEATLERPGFYPAGGGKIAVDIEPAARLEGIHLLERGRIRRCGARAIVARLPRHIAEREVKTIASRTGWRRDAFSIEEIADSAGPGNVVLIEVECEHVTEVFTAFGAIRVPAEKVATRAFRAFQRYRKAGVAVGVNLADQLIPLLAVAGEGSFETLPLTRHATTQIDLVERFLDVRVEVEETPAGARVAVRRFG